MADEELVVSYTVRELLGRIERNQVANHAELSSKLDGKADKSDIDRVRGDLAHVTQRLEKVESWQRDKDAAVAAHQRRDAQDERRRNWRIAIAGVALSAMMVMAALLPAVLR